MLSDWKRTETERRSHREFRHGEAKGRDEQKENTTLTPYEVLEEAFLGISFACALICISVLPAAQLPAAWQWVSSRATER